MMTKRPKKGRSIDALIADELEQQITDASDQAGSFQEAMEASEDAADASSQEASSASSKRPKKGDTEKGKPADVLVADEKGVKSLVAEVLRQKGIDPADVDYRERLRVAQQARRIAERHSESSMRERGLIGDNSFNTVTVRLPKQRHERLRKLSEGKRGGRTLQRIVVEALELWMQKNGLEW